MSSSTQFYVTLPSNASLSLYPNNTLSSYTTRLVDQINLMGNWEVAITEIHYPFSWYNITDDNNSFAYSSNGRFPVYGKIKPGYYSSIEEVVQGITEKLIEDGLESPFLELELIQSESSNNFFINRDFRQTLSPEIFAISLVNYIRSHNISSSTVSIDKLLYDPFSPGCIFKLNKEAIETLLEVVGSITSDNLFLDVSAGLSQVVIKNKEFVFKENIENLEKLLLEKTYE